jgi:hypothetical protein
MTRRWGLRLGRLTLRGLNGASVAALAGVARPVVATAPAPVARRLRRLNVLGEDTVWPFFSE